MTCSVCGKPARGLICLACLEQLRRVFALLVLMFLAPLSYALNFGGRSIVLNIGVDMTGSQHNPEYTKAALIVVESALLRWARVGDTVKLSRVCDHVGTVASLQVSQPITPRNARMYAKELLKPCTGRGSQITQQFKQWLGQGSGRNFYVLATDGLISDDPQASQLGQVAQRLMNNPNTYGLFVFGLSEKKTGLLSARDVFGRAVGGSQGRLVLAGLIDYPNAYGLFSQRIQGGRK